MALLLLGVSIVTFLLMCASPLDPLQTNIGQAALGTMSSEQIAKLQAYWGVDTPPLTRYLGWLTDVLKGDFGYVPSLPTAGAYCHWSAPYQFVLAAIVRMGDFGRAWIDDGCDCGGMPGQMAGPADQRILSSDL